MRRNNVIDETDVERDDDDGEADTRSVYENVDDRDASEQLFSNHNHV